MVTATPPSFRLQRSRLPPCTSTIFVVTVRPSPVPLPGAFVVKKWGFPENLEFLIKFFDDNEAMSRDKQLAQLVAIIALSDRMCQKFGMGWRNSGDNEVSFGNLPEVLGIEDASMPEILESVKTVFSQGADIY